MGGTVVVDTPVVGVAKMMEDNNEKEKMIEKKQ